MDSNRLLWQTTSQAFKARGERQRQKEREETLRERETDRYRDRQADRQTKAERGQLWKINSMRLWVWQ